MRGTMELAELNRDDEHRNIFRTVMYWTANVCAVVVLATFMVVFFCHRVTVSGHSMETSLTDGDVVLVNRAVYQFSDPERLDVIVFENENNSTLKTYVKRIIGLPGETVQIIDDKIWIDGEPLIVEDDLDLVTLSGLAADPVTLGSDEYFVLGDNRESSEDSRFINIGNVTRSQIQGRVWFRISPFADLGPVR